jgi:hypothetical protein
MGRPKKVKEDEKKVVSTEIPSVVIEEKKLVSSSPPPVIEEKKKRKYTKKEAKKNEEIDLIKEVENIDINEFKIQEETIEKEVINNNINEEEIKKIEDKEEKIIKREKRWEEMDYKPMIIKKKTEEIIYTEEDWKTEYVDKKINLYIYHTDISKNKIVTEEMMNERKFLYQIFIYGREGNDCVLKGEERFNLNIQKTYYYDNIQIHLLDNFPPIEEIKREEWRQYILFYKMDLKEMSEMMKLQRLMRKDLWFYEKYGNLIKMTIDNTYVLEMDIYIRYNEKKYRIGLKVKDLLEKMIA